MFIESFYKPIDDLVDEINDKFNDSNIDDIMRVRYRNLYLMRIELNDDFGELEHFLNTIIPMRLGEPG